MIDKCEFHVEHDLGSVCLDKQCNHRGLICQMCAFLNHRHHLIVPKHILFLSINDQAPVFQFFKKRVASQSKQNQVNLFTQTLLVVLLLNNVLFHLTKDHVVNLFSQTKESVLSLLRSIEGIEKSLLEQINKSHELFESKVNNIINYMKHLSSGSKESRQIVNMFVQESDRSQLELDENSLITRINVNEFTKLGQGFEIYQSEFEGQLNSISEFFERLEIFSDVNKLLDNHSLTNQLAFLRNDELRFANILERNFESNLFTQLNELQSNPKIEGNVLLKAEKKRFSPNNHNDIEKMIAQIPLLPEFSSLWIDIPQFITKDHITSTSNQIQKTVIRKCFFNFSKKTTISTELIKSLISSLQSQQKLEILGVNLKGCAIPNNFDWKEFMQTIAILKKYSLQKCLIYCDPNQMEGVQAAVMCSKDLYALNDMIELLK